MKALEAARPNLPQKPAKSGKPGVKAGTGRPNTVNDDDDDVASAAAASRPSSAASGKAAASKASKPNSAAAAAAGKKVQLLFYILSVLDTVPHVVLSLLIA